MTEAAATGVAQQHDEAAAWVYDPWREHPVVSTLATLAALALCGLVVWWRLPFVLSAVLCVACVVSFAPALSPVECRIDAGAAARRGLLGWQRRAWGEVRRVEALPAGALLSPYTHRRWLDSTRALVLPMPSGRRGELLARVGRIRESQRA